MSYNIKNEDGTLTKIAGNGGSGGGGGGTGTDNYNDLINKPKINGHTLTGNKTGEELDLVPDLSNYVKKEELPDLTDYLKRENLTDNSISRIKIQNQNDDVKFTDITDQTIQTKNIYANQETLEIGRSNTEKLKINSEIDGAVETSRTNFTKDNEFITKEYVDNKVIDIANQSDWTEEDEDSIAYIKNKPNNLVNTDELTRRINNLNLNQYFKKAGDNITNGTAGARAISATPDGLVGTAASTGALPEIRNFDIYDGDKKLEDKYVQKTVDAVTGKETVTIQSGTGAIDTVIDGQSVTTNTIASTTLTVESINDENATFEVDDEGNARFNNLNVENKIIAESIEINGKNIENVQSDWEETSNLSDAYIKNKPNLDSYATMTWVEEQINGLSPDPSQVLTQVNADWNETDTTKKSYILNKPENVLTRDNLTDKSITEIDLGTKIVLKDTGITGDGSTTIITDIKTVETYDLFAEDKVDVGIGEEGIVIDGISITANLADSTISGFESIDAVTLKENGLSLSNTYVSKEQLYEGTNILKGKLNLGDPDDDDYIRDTKSIINNIKTRMGGLRDIVFGGQNFPTDAIDLYNTENNVNLALIPSIDYSMDDSGEEIKYHYSTIVTDSPLIFTKSTDLNTKKGTGSWFTIDGDNLKFYPRKDWGYDNNIDITDDDDVRISYKVINGFNIGGGDTIEANTSISAPTINVDNINITNGINIDNFDTTNINVENIYGIGDAETTLNLRADSLTIRGNDTLTLYGGEIYTTGDIIPTSNKNFNLGNEDFSFDKIYSSSFISSGNVDTPTLNVRNIYGTKDDQDSERELGIYSGYLIIEGTENITLSSLRDIQITNSLLPTEENINIGSQDKKFDTIYTNTLVADNISGNINGINYKSTETWIDYLYKTLYANSAINYSKLSTHPTYEEADGQTNLDIYDENGNITGSISNRDLINGYEQEFDDLIDLTISDNPNKIVSVFQQNVWSYAETPRTERETLWEGYYSPSKLFIGTIIDGSQSSDKNKRVGLLFNEFDVDGGNSRLHLKYVSGSTSGYIYTDNKNIRPAIDNTLKIGEQDYSFKEAYINEIYKNADSIVLNSSLQEQIVMSPNNQAEIIQTLINCINALETRLAALES